MADELESLIYTSSAVVEFSLASVDALALKSATSNARHGVTGYMGFRDGRFVQYLEGTPTGLDHVYARVRNDERHHIDFEQRLPATSRRFPAWFMEHLRLGGTREHEAAVEAVLIDAIGTPPDQGQALESTLTELVDRVGLMYLAALA